ncbi:ArsI/CadI family heavy metal resistance metalloenzyme [Ramlibacter humi]|uniref:Glyoxalase/bleomycin resistance/dioxygenase family protein n=1 Tax=Ramlibacter humi TaxID=2530451 RepID=A0A4Z0BIE9_9BURK|nr:ArsI/CadI family heavy metal resistance metalloenzyme [Ramlibacter humi]TFY98179.1 glyoxalase/bleomycin resistance/dioxygenase family protein [Ramlibacter humi]
MKRFHVHVRVADLAASVAFYNRLFGAEPSRREADYAKWMLDDPRINFAISTRGGEAGLDHLGFQTDDASELAELRQRAEAADMAVLPQGEVACCYSRSDKHWVTDPQGIAWEHFHTLGDVPVYGDGGRQAAGAACCTPAQVAVAIPTRAKANCC